LNLQVDENLLAFHNFLAIWTSIASFIKVNMKVSNDQQEEKWISEELQNNELVDTLNPLHFK
jgi:hypothetical protein